MTKSRTSAVIVYAAESRAGCAGSSRFSMAKGDRSHHPRSAAAVEVDVMSSNEIKALFRRSLMWIWAAVLAGFLPASALTESAQAQSTAAVQAVVPAEPHSETGATANIGTVAPLSAPNPGANAVSAVQSQIDPLELLSPAQRQTYQHAASAFTYFCHDWERLLHEREVNNLEHLSWRDDGGLKTASYTGYGKVESCECKASKEGLPIGKIRYEEINYSIAGKTIDEARHAAPKLMHEISTLEIFSWEKDKWFY